MKTTRATLTPYLFVLPAMAVLLAFHLLPLLYVIAISLFKDWGSAQARFVGLDNYRLLLTGGQFAEALAVTVWYAVGTIPATLAAALLFAVLMNRPLVGRRLFRVIFFLPYITSTVAAAAVWRWIFHVDDRGLANTMLSIFHLGPFRFTEDSRGLFDVLFGHAIPLLGTGPSIALLSVMVFSVWQTFGFYVIILAAGLAQIPKQTLEAASLDGAGPIRTFFSITLPQLRSVMGFLIIVSTIGAFQTFNQIYIMAPAERLYSARNVTMYIVTEFWDYNRFGIAAAGSVILFVILVAMTLIQSRLTRRKDI